MAVVARGKILIWEAIGLWVLRGESSSSRIDHHSHHAIQVTVALEGEFELKTACASVRGPAAIVAADESHVFCGSGIAAFVFIEPESGLGRSLSAEWLRDRRLVAITPDIIAPFRSVLLAAFQSGAEDEQLQRIVAELLATLGATETPNPPDTRVAKMIAFVAENLDERLSLAIVARHVNLSASRASHLFVEQIGLPLKTYLLWLRLKRAVAGYAEGATLTDAAHGAGFADSAHLSRTFRRMFGLSAASLRVNQREV